MDSRADTGIIAINGVLAHESDLWNAADPRPPGQVISAVFVTERAPDNEIPDSINPALHDCCKADFLWAVDVGGERPIPESLRGMSGGAAWSLPGDPWEHGWTLRSPALCGIQSSVITTGGRGRHAYCRIIKWRAVIEFLKACYPVVAESEKSAHSILLAKYLRT
jgi:hypothetical protein